MEIPVLMGQALFLFGSVLVGMIVHRLTRLELTLACLLSGVFSGLVVGWSGFDTGIRASNIQNLVFYLILPVLIFEAAWRIKPAVLRRWLTPVLVLSTVGLVLSCLTVAVLVYYAVGEPQGFPWTAALLTGAILAATNPVAVVSSLKRLKAPEDLAVLVEGESLFNNAGALVLFGLMLSFAVAPDVQMDRSYLGLFSVTLLGGLLLGAVLGLIGSILVLLLGSTPASNIVLLFLAFTSLYLAEQFFYVSGIMSLISAAIVSRTLLREHEQRILGSALDTWDWLGLSFKALIFVLMGLVITFEMFTQQWLAMVIAIVAAFIARAVAVLISCQLVRPFKRAVPMGWQYILVWGGLRGAMAIVLVLSLPLSLPYWWTVQSMVFGVVLFTLLFQGSTAGWLIKRHGQLPPANLPGQ